MYVFTFGLKTALFNITSLSIIIIRYAMVSLLNHFSFTRRRAQGDQVLVSNLPHQNHLPKILHEKFIGIVRGFVNGVAI